MLKKLLLIMFCIICANAVVFAQTSPEEIVEQIKTHRTSIYESLDLSPIQKEKINELDIKHYQEIKPDLEKISVMTKKLDEIANSDNCTIKAVNKVKKEFKPVEKDMWSVKKSYEKEFNKLLTPEQKSIYKTVRAQKREELKQEMIKKQKSLAN